VKLPNPELAIVDIGKLRDYCLNPKHPRGRHKARVFASVGIHQTDAVKLQSALLWAALHCEAESAPPSPYGERYIVDFDYPAAERPVRIRSSWIVRAGEGIPRLTSCYVISR
jgi:hypothetical protein